MNTNNSTRSESRSELLDKMIVPRLVKILQIKDPGKILYTRRMSYSKSEEETSFSINIKLNAEKVKLLSKYVDNKCVFSLEDQTEKNFIIKATCEEEPDKGKTTILLYFEIESTDEEDTSIEELLQGSGVSTHIYSLETKSSSSKSTVYVARIKDGSILTRKEIFKSILDYMEKSEESEYKNVKYIDRDSYSSEGYIQWGNDTKKYYYRLYLKFQNRLDSNLLAMICELFPIALLRINKSSPPKLNTVITSKAFVDSVSAVLDRGKKTKGVDRVLSLIQDMSSYPDFQRAIKSKAPLVDTLVEFYAKKGKEEPDRWGLDESAMRWEGMNRLGTVGGLQDRTDLVLNKKCHISLKEENNSSATSHIFLCNTSIFSAFKNIYNLTKSYIPPMSLSTDNPESCYRSLLGDDVEKMDYRTLVRRGLLKLLGSYGGVSRNVKANKALAKYILGSYNPKMQDEGQGYNHIIIVSGGSSSVVEMGLTDDFVLDASSEDRVIEEVEIEEDCKTISYKTSTNGKIDNEKKRIEIYLLNAQDSVNPKDGKKKFLSKALKFKTLKKLDK